MRVALDTNVLIRAFRNREMYYASFCYQLWECCAEIAIPADYQPIPGEIAKNFPNNSEFWKWWGHMGRQGKIHYRPHSNLRDAPRGLSVYDRALVGVAVRNRIPLVLAGDSRLRTYAVEKGVHVIWLDESVNVWEILKEICP